MVAQYGRKLSFVIADDSGDGIELNNFSSSFIIHHSTFSFPHTANVRIYNLAPDTREKVGTEFTKVQIKAGYEGNFGTIFQGAIKQVRKGRENATDTFVDIFAADGDRFHNFGVINKSLPAGYTQDQVWKAIGEVAGDHDVTQTPLAVVPSASPAPRGKVMYGMARDHLRDWGNTNSQLVTVDAGSLTAMPLLAYKKTDAIDINVSSGMVGVPEQTEQGITVTTLLNPAISWGSLVRINNKDITQNLYSSWNEEGLLRQTVDASTYPLPARFPDVADDGYYRVLAVDHMGEIRGQPWYSCLICLSIDPSSATHIPDAAIGLNTYIPSGGA